MAIVVISCLSMLVGVLGAVCFGIGGMLFSALGIPILLFLKTISETDDQGARIFALEVLCQLKKRNGKYFGNTYTLSPMSYGRRKHVYKRFFENSTCH